MARFVSNERSKVSAIRWRLGSGFLIRERSFDSLDIAFELEFHFSPSPAMEPVACKLLAAKVHLSPGADWLISNGESS